MGDLLRMHTYQSDPRYLAHYPWAQRSIEDVRRMLDMFISYQREQPRRCYQLAVTAGEDGMLLGSCGLRKPAAETIRAELGYELDPAVWGHGYATECTRAMLTWGFAALGLSRVRAQCVSGNTRSARVLTKLGFRLEGRLREQSDTQEGTRDNLVFGLLAHEWRP